MTRFFPDNMTIHLHSTEGTGALATLVADGDEHVVTGFDLSTRSDMVSLDEVTFTLQMTVKAKPKQREPAPGLVLVGPGGKRIGITTWQPNCGVAGLINDRLDWWDMRLEGWRVVAPLTPEDDDDG